MSTAIGDLREKFDGFSEAYNRLSTEMEKSNIPIDLLDEVLDSAKEVICTTFAPP